MNEKILNNFLPEKKHKNKNDSNKNCDYCWVKY